MTNEDRTPNPLENPRYGVAQCGALGLFDSAGWAPPPAGQYATFDGDLRRDYGPKGGAGIVYGVTATAVLTVLVLALVVAGVL